MSFTASEIVSIETQLAAFCRDYVPPHMRRRLRINYGIVGYEIHISERKLCTPDDPLWIVTNIAKLQHIPDSHTWVFFKACKSGTWGNLPEIQPTPDLQSVIDRIAEIFRNDKY